MDLPPDQPRAESAMGEGERSSAETQAHNISSRQKENRSRTAGKVGEAEGGEEVGCVGQRKGKWYIASRHGGKWSRRMSKSTGTSMVMRPTNS